MPTSSSSSSLMRTGAGYDPRLQTVLPGTWTIRTCRACGDILHGPSIACESCQQAVHGHCAVRRLGAVVCRACADDLDFQFRQHQAQRLLTASNM